MKKSYSKLVFIKNNEKSVISTLKKSTYVARKEAR